MSLNNWKRGFVLKNSQTDKWDNSMMEFNNKLEQERVYSNFLMEDQGKTRNIVCTLNPQHKDYEKNAQLIVGAPLMFNNIVLIADRDGYEYLFDLVEQITGERWTKKRMNEEAQKIRKQSNITY